MAEKGGSVLHQNQNENQDPNQAPNQNPPLTENPQNPPTPLNLNGHN